MPENRLREREATTRLAKPKAKKAQPSIKFSGSKTDSWFAVLDAVAWLDLPEVGQVAQFANIDPRTAGRVLRNGVTIGLMEEFKGRYSLALPYPYKGSEEQKRAVVREAFVRMPLLQNARQFLKLGDSLEDAARKSATILGERNYDQRAIAPLLQWATELHALEASVDVEGLIDSAAAAKDERHDADSSKRVVFLSHSSKDKPIVRKLATDLTAEGIQVWLDELHIVVGDSIPERIAQGLAASDFFLIALSRHSLESAWVQRELNSALVAEIARRKIKILPILLEDVEVPALLKDKKYADFRTSYKEGFEDLLRAITSGVKEPE